MTRIRRGPASEAGREWWPRFKSVDSCEAAPDRPERLSSSRNAGDAKVGRSLGVGQAVGRFGAPGLPSPFTGNFNTEQPFTGRNAGKNKEFRPVNGYTM